MTAMEGKATRLAIEDLFERVRAHLLAQQCRSEDADGEPRYRGPSNRRCGIGALIDDAHYRADIEGLGVSLLRVPGNDPLSCALRRSGVDVDDDRVVELLIDLQDIHDLQAIDRWPTALEAVRCRLAGAAPASVAASAPDMP
ncbi:Inclusion body protein [Ralstonia solanacearum]|nr:Inclusion body protein [Ralstonia solanacearum]